MIPFFSLFKMNLPTLIQLFLNERFQEHTTVLVNVLDTIRNRSVTFRINCTFISSYSLLYTR